MQRTLPRTTLPTFSRDAAFGHLLAMLQLIRLWRQRSRTRRQLARLDERQLADIGISPAAREVELDKPFWR
ncbi:hypothetical protein DN824_08525 [Stutzerimonas nosocomialis]|uniref:YjiS-like domain-containing protein n=1 Tax=Stutzerimonas nosocomialis TaxID=1056496 RepID=A0A5R9QBF3_9GAMM|nr:DUF1127 domain-containing protein [Stutzerimonas nosocomialis]TLX57670.1 hypothetical protein DN826_07265 [Stutzerimonas nosocomialis]TLX59141.1 hypothetical protein DN824_08525 [Stutzerimonas nosocomialis]TLX62469.1 hypothetical protein DN820_15995 [Stutzerimonas nosocomialis]